jgi:hypothetical protein
MIRAINAQGFPTLSNASGVAFQMPHPLARELYRQNVQEKDDLRKFLEDWGADSEGLVRLLDDDFEPKAFREGLANLGLTLETLRDLIDERKFFVSAYGREPQALVLHPSELGVIATALSKEEKIADIPLRPRRDEAALKYLQEQLTLVSVSTDDKVSIGGYR